jgi:undecaprenyl-diphosphatase
VPLNDDLADVAVGSAPPGRGAMPPPPAPSRWQRHPADVARLGFCLALLGAIVVLDRLAEGVLAEVSADVVALAANVPPAAAGAIVGIVQLVALAVPPVAVAVLVWQRRWALLGVIGLAVIVGAVVMALTTGLVDRGVPSDVLDEDRLDEWFIGVRFPSASYLSALVAALVAATPWLPRRWRRAGWILVALVAGLRLLTATVVPVHIPTLVVIGAAAGSAALLIFGAPPRRADTQTVRAALAAAGLPVDVVRPLARSGTPTYEASGVHGRAFVRLIGRDERDTDLFARAVRAVRVKGLGDDRPVVSPRRAVEHEALALAVAGGAGARVAAPLAVGSTEDEAAVIAATWHDGTTLDQLPDAALTDEVLGALWREIATLQDRRVAHRSLTLSNVLVEDGRPVLIDFRRADIAANDRLLGADVAQLLAATVVRLGAPRAVALAAAALPAEQLARAVPLLQPAVLRPSTRAELKSRKGLLAEARAAAAAAVGVDRVELAEVHRVTLKGAVTLVGSVVMTLYLLSIVSNWSEIWDSMQSADSAYILPILFFALVPGYFGGAYSLTGAVTTDLPLLRTTAVMYAQSFLNRFTPANAGGMALRTRYLQVNGVELTVAAAAVALTSAASGVVQVVFIVVFFLWGGTTDAFSEISLPQTSVVILVLVGVAAIVGGVVLSGWGRRVVLPWARTAATKALGELRQLAADPLKSLRLFGGAALAKLTTIVAFSLSVQAFGVDMSFAKAGALYLVASTVGSAVPTPGGVGGIEAALTAVLLSFGVENATAAAIVLLFRFMTFWLPTVPGWFFLQYVQRRQIV